MHVGEQLRQAREARRVSIDAVARVTRVPPAALAAIERNDIEALPPHPYNRGFVAAYAREVGLDPQQTARDFVNQFADRTPVRRIEAETPPHVVIEGRPRRLVWLAVPAVALLVFFMTSREPASDDALVVREAPPVPEPDPAPATSRTMDAGEPQPASASTPSPALHARAVSVVLVADRPVWLEARADGQRVVYELLEAGSERRLSADRDLLMRVGDAGAVSVTINNRNVGVLGAPGAVRNLRITPANVDTIR
jgi:cytoskeletal protein RodZ